MLDREWLGQVQGYLATVRDPSRSRTLQLEARLFVAILVLRALVAFMESLQDYYDDADIATLLAAATATQPLEADGTLMKRSIQQYLAMLVSFRTWTTTNVSAGVQKTPRQLLAQQPEKVAAA
jgi:hypothetical protein